MPTKVGELIRCALLLVGSLLLVMVASEALLQLTEIGSFSYNRRVLFYSQPSFEYLDNGVIHYYPDTAIRTVAVYGSHIDYDVTNHTNNLGFFDNVNYVKPSTDTTNIAFIGDSFTSGSGGSLPWVISLRQSADRADLTLYSLGVSGTGFHNFAALLDHYSEPLAIDEINIMMITSDLYRTVWYPLSDDDGVRLCWSMVSAQACKAKFDTTMLPVSHNATHEEILAKSQEIYTRRSADPDLEKSFIQRLRLFNLVCNAVHKISKDTNTLLRSCPHLRGFKTRSGTKDILFKQSFELLSQMKAMHPHVRFRLFHIPERGETFKRKYAVNIVKEMEKLQIDYVPLLYACDWKSTHYHKHDGHPNDNGYKHLAMCVKPYLPPEAGISSMH